MRFILNQNDANKIFEFYENILSSSEYQDRSGISDFWKKRLDKIFINRTQLNKECVITIDTKLDYASPLSKTFLIDRINIHLALRFIKKLGIASENTEMLKKILNLSIPKNSEKEIKKITYKIKGKYLTLRFIQGIFSVYNFVLACLLNKHTLDNNVIILEVGAGTGTIGIVFKELLAKSTYIIVDLPQPLLTSAVYLSTIYPNQKKYFYNGSTLTPEILKDNDFIFLPHFAIKDLPSDSCEIVWNESSMGEMEPETVNNYFAEIRRIIKPNGLFYNSNRYNKITRFLDYPYKEGDRHIYMGYNEFHRLATKIVMKRPTKFIPYVQLPIIQHSHVALLMVWISYLQKD